MKSKYMKKQCIDPDYFDIVTKGVIEDMNLQQLNESILSYKIQNSLLMPVKKSIPTRIEDRCYTLDWNGKQWNFTEWDIDNERAYPLDLDNNSYEMFVKEFRLEESRLSQEQMVMMSPQELVIKGNWRACDYYGICEAKTDPAIKLESFDKEYCESYQYVLDICPLERMLLSAKIRDLPRIKEELAEKNHEDLIKSFIKKINKISSLEGKLYALTGIYSYEDGALKQFLKNLHLETKKDVRNNWFSYTEDGDEGVKEVLEVTTMRVYYGVGNKEENIIFCEVDEKILSKMKDPSKAYSEYKDSDGRTYREIIKNAVLQLKREYLENIAKQYFAGEKKEVINNSIIQIKPLKGSPKDEYCVALSVSNRIVPGIEDFFFHINSSGEVMGRHYESYTDSQYQNNKAMICPGCRTKFIVYNQR
ncbi:MAG: hypothetical protein KKE20_06640 [Nanoarchaeota archaeon]|nr:hypothetical protein [Nanoarchaeota archaeon]